MGSNKKIDWFRYLFINLFFEYRLGVKYSVRYRDYIVVNKEYM